MTPAADAEFPTPDQRPGADVVLFDGQCNFCRAQMRRLVWWDRGGRLAYLSIHDPAVSDRWPDLSHERLLREMCVVESDEPPPGPQAERRPQDHGSANRHWGADAVRYLAWKLPRLRWLAPLLRVPGAMAIARPAYRLVARNRYLLGGKRDVCETDACAVRR